MPTYPDPSNVLSTAPPYGDAGELQGTFVDPGDANVRGGFGFGAEGTRTGEIALPDPSHVRFNEGIDHTTGTLIVPDFADVRLGVQVDATTGTLVGPSDYVVKMGEANPINDAGIESVGMFDATEWMPSNDTVLNGTGYGYAGSSFFGDWTPPNDSDVKEGVEYGVIGFASIFGSYTASEWMPLPWQVWYGVTFGSPNNGFTGVLVGPANGDVRAPINYSLDDAGNPSTGACYVPAPQDVRQGTNVDYNQLGTLVVTGAGSGTQISSFGIF